MEDTKIVIFKNKQVRKVLYKNEWWFSVVDVCEALTDSVDPGAYWRKLKQRLIEEGSEVVTFCHGLKLEASDGKKYETDCADTEGIFRPIQSIPSPKAEPFKRWLAKVGYERVQEIENPELAVVVLQKFNKDMFWGIPLTTRPRDGKFYEKIMHDKGVAWAMLTQMRVFSTKRLLRKIGMISGEDFAKIQKRMCELVIKIEPLHEGGVLGGRSH